MTSAIDTIAWASSRFTHTIVCASQQKSDAEYQAQSQWMPLGQLGIGVNDVGFRQSVVGVERLRTYDGCVLELKQHLIRYRRTLDFLAIDLHVDEATIGQRIGELIDRNKAWCDREKDFGITMLATPGERSTGNESDVTQIIHLNPLDHSKIEQHQKSGHPLVVTSVKQPSAECWPRDIKVRCRL
ncbi:MAG TPA: hypothetical protein DDZ51_25865, partial [Planctomycetaceae bacterium]|nr:hypothetical protein [Planctomycetaceae bacterium]